jgi:hypothetical protein
MHYFPWANAHGYLYFALTGQIEVVNNIIAKGVSG